MPGLNPISRYERPSPFQRADSDNTKQEIMHEEVVSPGIKETNTAQPGRGELVRGLKQRHVAMIAIAGSIGTGLIIGTGAALAKAGPAGIFITYSMVGLIVFQVLSGMGEMAAWLPMPSGFTGYATRFVDPSLGFALGWVYWCRYIVAMPNQLVASSLVIQYWLPSDKVNPAVFVAIFLVAIIFINFFGVAVFGEMEFWFGLIKCITLLGLIILCVILAAGGGPNHHATGFQYWSDPGAFHPYILHGSAGNFLSFWSGSIDAVFAYAGIELIGVTAGETQNPTKAIPKAIRLTFVRICFFYVAAVFVLGLLVPYNSEELLFAVKSRASANASPFIVAVVLAGIPVLPGFFNACILFFTFSTASSDLYVAVRTLYGLAKENKAPAIFARTDNRGVPLYALAASSIFGCLGFMTARSAGKVVFTYLVNVVTIFGLLTWISLLVAHIGFVRARRAQGVANSQMHYVAPAGIIGSYAALVVCVLIALFKNFDVFVPSVNGGQFNYKGFITGYLGIPLYLVLIFGCKWYWRPRRSSNSLHTITGQSFTWLFGRNGQTLVANALHGSEEHMHGPEAHETYPLVLQKLPDELPCDEFVEYMVQTTLFRLGPVYYLVDKVKFLARMQMFYKDTKRGVRNVTGLWFVQLLLFVALGKLFVGVAPSDIGPPVKLLHGTFPRHRPLYDATFHPASIRARLRNPVPDE
ncbi:dicarboxylic amino acid permease [Purpureocillium lilacinum]|uniref:Dicarboxylic amino acid permease n=3 Tax=Purpureocillium lilacinum TaxID=33203 RepID=A0A179HA89_PURLI|nr:dicarboxylic amino acid permease [Purpureocillium lilacinum]